MSDHEIDELFGLGLGDSSLPFDESAWAGAEKAIIANERRRRRRAIFLWFTGALLLLSSGFGYYSYQQNTPLAEKVRIQDSQKPIPTQENNSPLSNDNPEQPEEENGESSEEPTNENAPSEPVEDIPETLNLPMSSLKENPVIAIVDEDEEAKIEDQIPEEVESVQSLNFISLSLLNPREAREIENAFDQIIKGDISEASNIPYKTHWNKRLNLVAGTNPSLATMEFSDSEYGDVPYFVGLTFSKIHNYSLEYGIGAIYEQILYSDNRKEIVQDNFGFGRETSTYQIEKIKGNYISIPVYVKYRIFRKHHLMAGLQYSHLLQTNSSYSLRSENGSGLLTRLKNSENITGFQDDLSQSQFVGLLGYDYAFSDRLRLQALARIGATSLYDDAGNIFSNDERLHFKIGIEYSLWRY